MKRDMEHIVRPFQAQEVFDARRNNKSPAPEAPELCELVLVGSVATETLQENLKQNFNTIMDFEVDTKETKVHTITDPNDPSISIEVEDVTRYDIVNKIDNSRISIRPWEKE